MVILADRETNWRPASFAYGMAGFRAGIDYMMVKLVDQLPRQEELSASGNPIAALVLAHFKTQETHGDPESRREWKLRLVRGLYERGWSEDRVRRMFRVLDRMMQLPKGLELAFRS